MFRNLTRTVRVFCLNHSFKITYDNNSRKGTCFPSMEHRSSMNAVLPGQFLDDFPDDGLGIAK